MEGYSVKEHSSKSSSAVKKIISQDTETILSKTSRKLVTEDLIVIY